jgi:hypothetical protein
VAGRSQIINESTGEVLASRAEVASSFWRRGVGLLGRTDWSASDGLVIAPCNSIHCFFMSLTIDVVYLDRGGKVLRVVPKLRPWRIGPLVWSAHSVVELPLGTTTATNCQPGHRLVIKPVEG